MSEPEDSPIHATTSKSYIHPKPRYPIGLQHPLKPLTALSLLTSPKPKANKKHHHKAKILDNIRSDNEHSKSEDDINSDEDEDGSNEHEDDEDEADEDAGKNKDSEIGM